MPRFLNIDQIEVGPRQRKKYDTKPLNELKDSISDTKTGLINPIVVMDLQEKNPSGLPRFRLVAGGRRLRAIKELHSERRVFSHEEATVTSGTIPVTIIRGRALSSLLQIEYDENVVRLDLEWQEQVEAIQQLDEAKKQEAADEGRRHEKKDTIEAIQKSLGGSEKISTAAVTAQVTQALTLAPLLLDRPDLHKAKSAYEAYRIVLREQHERFAAELSKRKLAKVDPNVRLWDLRQGNARDVLVALPDNLVDLVLVDPPYGIGVHTEKYAASTLHRYDDSEQYARDLCIFVLQECWRLTKGRANLFMFCKWKSFGILRDAAAQYGWTPWNDPIIWQKSQAEGEAPWGRQGFIKTYEMLLYVTKGQRGLDGPLMDTLVFNKVGARARIHGAEKPPALLEYLIEKSTIPNDLVLDPCAGSGTTLLAAARKKRRALGIELDPTYYARAMTRMANFEEGKNDDEVEQPTEATAA